MQRRFYGIEDKHGDGKFTAGCMMPGCERNAPKLVFGVYDTKPKVAPRGPRPFFWRRRRENAPLLKKTPQAAMHFNYGTSVVAAGVRRAARVFVVVDARARPGPSRPKHPKNHRSA